MVQFLKPDNLNNVWASGGDKIYPGNTKYAAGWQVEIPPRQYFNQIDYKQDQMLAHLNQHGIPVWDGETEYQANKSYVQGHNGEIYRAIVTNTNTDPVGDITNSWVNPFAKPSDVPVASTDYIIYPNGLVDQWASNTGIVGSGVGSSADITVTLPVKLSNILNVQVTQGITSSLEAAEMLYSVFSQSLGATGTTVTIRFRRASGSNTTGTEVVTAAVRVLGIAA